MSEVEVKELKESKSKSAPFLAPEKVERIDVDPSTVFNLPKKYVPRWIAKADLASNRKGYWVVVDKTHPEFKDVRVTRDDTQSGTMFTRGDLVLCVMHRDTNKQMKSIKSEQIKRRVESVDAKQRSEMDQIAKEGIGSLRTVLKNNEEE